jgi:hypothetical protein
VVAGKSFMAIWGCDMAVVGGSLRRIILAFSLAVEMAFRWSGRSNFFLVGRNIGTSSKGNGQWIKIKQIEI